MTASVQADSFLTLHYRISTLAGEEFLSTFDMSPATLQMGSGQLAESLEEVLLGLEQGGHYVFELEAEQFFPCRFFLRARGGNEPGQTDCREDAHLTKSR